MVCALITLKPNQPTVRIQAPSARKGCSTADARSSHRPCGSGLRAPSSSTAARPIQPPTACTTTLPAKSWNSPAAASMPAPARRSGCPRCALEERVDQADDQAVAASCGPNARARRCRRRRWRDGRREGEQEEELHQLVAVLRRQLGAAEEARCRRRRCCSRRRSRRWSTAAKSTRIFTSAFTWFFCAPCPAPGRRSRRASPAP